MEPCAAVLWLVLPYPDSRIMKKKTVEFEIQNFCLQRH